jgi:hypothetical protein
LTVKKTADEAIDGIVRPAVISARAPAEVAAAAAVVLVRARVEADLEVEADLVVEVAVPEEGLVRVVDRDRAVRRLDCNGIGKVAVVDLAGKNPRAIPCRRSKWSCNPSPRGLRRWPARSS